MTLCEQASPPWQVQFPEDGQSATVQDPERSLLDISLSLRIPHVRECGGNGRCTTCRVRVLEGLAHCSPRSALEARIAAARGWDDRTRLACQTRSTGNLTLQRQVRNNAERSRLFGETAAHEPGRAVPMAVLFCDLRGFTPISERHGAYDVVHILNRYYERIGEAVVLNSGYIFQYVGDELVAWFGLEGGSPRLNSHNAVRSALGILEQVRQVNTGLQADFGESLQVSIGLHYGAAIVGSIGHASHKQLTAVGEAINLAKRIETMNREAGTTLLASAELLRYVPVELVTGQRLQTELKGFSREVELVEVLGFKEPDALLIVQNSAQQLLADGDAFGQHFYERVFALAPQVRSLFSDDLTAQSRMFVDMLGRLLQGLGRFDELVAGLRREGRRHAGYGVQPEHYPVVLQAFLETLEARMGAQHSPQVHWAWEQTLTRNAEVMLEGAETA